MTLLRMAWNGATPTLVLTGATVATFLNVLGSNNLGLTSETMWRTLVFFGVSFLAAIAAEGLLTIAHDPKEDKLDLTANKRVVQVSAGCISLSLTIWLINAGWFLVLLGRTAAACV